MEDRNKESVMRYSSVLALFLSVAVSIAAPPTVKVASSPAALIGINGATLWVDYATNPSSNVVLSAYWGTSNAVYGDWAATNANCVTGMVGPASTTITGLTSSTVYWFNWTARAGTNPVQWAVTPLSFTTLSDTPPLPASIRNITISGWDGKLTGSSTNFYANNPPPLSSNSVAALLAVSNAIPLAGSNVTARTVGSNTYYDAAMGWKNPTDSTNWTWTSDGKEITLTGYNFNSLDVVFPDMLDGLPVVTFAGTVFNDGNVGTAIKSVSGGANLVSIPDGAFIDCQSLTNVTLLSVSRGSGANSVLWGRYAFYGCSNLITVDMPSMTVFGEHAFSGGNPYPSTVSLRSLTLPSLKSVEFACFIDSGIVTFNAPALTNIAYGAFEQCTNLYAVNAPNVVSVGDSAFRGASQLPSISLPVVAAVADNAFWGCSNLTAVYFGKDCPTVGNHVYSNAVSVTNYVSDPLAAGWSSTLSLRPVVRPSVKGLGSELTGITPTQVGALSTTGGVLSGVLDMGGNSIINIGVNSLVFSDGTHLGISGSSLSVTSTNGTNVIITTDTLSSNVTSSGFLTSTGSASSLTGLTVGQTNLNELLKDPSGWAGDTDSARYLFDAGSRVLTITNAVSMQVYRNGHLLTNALSLSWPAIGTNTGTWYMKFNQTDGAMSTTQVPWGLDDIQAATVYWTGGSNGTAYVSEETHGFMPWSVHRRFHLAPGEGSLYASGFPLTAASTNFVLGTGNWFDEDIYHAESASLSTARVLYMTNGNMLAATAIRGIYYVTNAATSDLQYNRGGTQMVDVATTGGGAYMGMYLYITPLVDNPLVWVVGRSTSAIASDIVNENPPDLAGFLPSAEAVLLYKVILRGVNNAPAYSSTVDYRASKITGSAYTPVTHNTLTGRDAADVHPLASITGYGALLTNLVVTINGTNYYTATNAITLPVIAGPVGDTGATGAQGVAGSNGIQGVQGIQGPAGSNAVWQEAIQLPSSTGVVVDAMATTKYVMYTTDNITMLTPTNARVGRSLQWSITAVGGDRTVTWPTNEFKPPTSSSMASTVTVTNGTESIFVIEYRTNAPNWKLETYVWGY